MGFRVIVAVTGHYPSAQVEMIERAAEARMVKPGVVFIWAGPECISDGREDPHYGMRGDPPCEVHPGAQNGRPWKGPWRYWWRGT